MIIGQNFGDNQAAPQPNQYRVLLFSGTLASVAVGHSTTIMWLQVNRLFLSKTRDSLGCGQIITAIRKWSSKVEEQKINVNGLEINYVKTGNGPHPVLLLPGALGSAWTDFKPQIENLDKSKLTVVAWDPPGYGKSRPPDRTFPENFFKRDAGVAHDLMKTLGYDKFSLIGWSDGGITSFILAADHPHSIRKMIAFGANSYIKPSELKVYESIRNIDTWSERMKAPLIAMYGEDYFRQTWSAWVNAMSDLYQKKNGDICKDCIPRIRCPALLIHGAKDVMVDPEHPEYLKKNIADSELKFFEKGSHNLHLRYHEEFNELVTKFLLE